jgi:hypothetical protein
MLIPDVFIVRSLYSFLFDNITLLADKLLIEEEQGVTYIYKISVGIYPVDIGYIAKKVHFTTQLSYSDKNSNVSTLRG